MKNFLLFFTIFTTASHSAPYVEWKHQAKFQKIDKSIEQTDHFRLGYKTDSNYYFEVGPRTHGISMEAGFKFKHQRHWLIKGKIESNRAPKWKHGVETEVRYTFD